MDYYMFAMIALLSVGHLYGHIGIDSFEQNIAKSALHLSQSAYCMTHNSNWDCITCDSSNKLAFVLEEHNELVIQGYNSETDSLFVSFRGSVNIPNWIDNIQISKIAPYDVYAPSFLPMSMSMYFAYKQFTIICRRQRKKKLTVTVATVLKF